MIRGDKLLDWVLGSCVAILIVAATIRVVIHLFEGMFR